jgi:hypothetical protein
MSRYPDFSLERDTLAKYPDAMIIGIDEAGRGPWAGPGCCRRRVDIP